MSKLKIVTKSLAILLLASLLIYRAVVLVSRHALESYEVRGVDVSSYQGEIDWETLSQSEIDFAFIKATEGSSYKDRFFEKNIEGIAETELAAGAYHFLSFESDGAAQAENFIDSVKREDITLPPVIDLELYGEYANTPPSSPKVRRILDEMITRLYVEYGEYPIIYTNRRAYTLYVSGEYKNCDIWICDIVKKPTLPDGREWTFWQYSHTEQLPGYDGEEKYIDMNVFNGSRALFERYKKELSYDSSFCVPIFISPRRSGRRFRI